MALRHRAKRRLHKATFYLLDKALNGYPEPWTRVQKIKLISSVSKKKIRDKADTRQVDRRLALSTIAQRHRCLLRAMAKSAAIKTRNERRKRLNRKGDRK